MDQKTVTVLIADDELVSREVLKTAMSSWAYTVCEAVDGEEAWKCFLEQSPAVIITDLVMPKLGGLELLRRVKAVKPDTQVVLVSAYGSMSDAMTAVREGAADFLTKPIDYGRLKGLLQGHIAASRGKKIDSEDA